MNNMSTEERRNNAKEFLSKGIKVNRFRKTKIDNNTNRILLALLYANNIKVSDLAKYTSITTRSVERWIYEKGAPSNPNKKLLEQLFNLPYDTIFPDYAYNYKEIDLSMIKLDDKNYTFLRRPTSRIIYKKILYGLMWVHNISTYELSILLDVDQNTLGRWLFTSKMPRPKYISKLENIFNIPFYILIKNMPNEIKITGDL